MKSTHNFQKVSDRREEPTQGQDVLMTHWVNYAEAFAQPLQSNGLISKFVANPNVTGLYAEAWIRSTATTMLGRRFRISTGAVIRPADQLRDLRSVPQCDLIVWDPSELPGIFESGEFALVPLAAVRAIIEVKRTINSKDDLLKQLQERAQLAPRDKVLGVVVSHPTNLLNRKCTPDWLKEKRVESAITRLLNDKNEPDTDGVMAFIYFLAQVAGHTRDFVTR